MSDRINTITVVLEEDIRDDDCEPILAAIGMVKGVLKATPNVAKPSDYAAEERAKREIRRQLERVIYPE